MKQRCRRSRFVTARHLIGMLTILAMLVLSGAPASAQKPEKCEPAWSEPVPLGPEVNSTANDVNATLSADGLSLYFISNRTGDNDIYVSQRACADCDWETAEPLGPNVNTDAPEGGPSLSADGHLLFFHRDRDGNNDIYVSYRTNPNDDFGWQPATPLGPLVNTTAGEFSPEFLNKSEDGSNAATLYFGRGTPDNQDLYKAPISRDGEVLGAAVPVVELNDAAVTDAAPTVRGDGKLIMFWSPRAGSAGADIWFSTRQNVHDEWSQPENLGPPINTAANERRPNLSHTGRTLLFDRVGPFGLLDIWESTRLPGCR